MNRLLRTSRVVTRIVAALVFGAMASAQTAGEAEAAALFGHFSLGIAGYVVVAAEVGLIAGVTALTSRQVVIHTLRHIE